jgi:hypothetical protein
LSDSDFCERGSFRESWKPSTAGTNSSWPSADHKPSFTASRRRLIADCAIKAFVHSLRQLAFQLAFPLSALPAIGGGISRPSHPRHQMCISASEVSLAVQAQGLCRQKKHPSACSRCPFSLGMEGNRNCTRRQLALSRGEGIHLPRGSRSISQNRGKKRNRTLRKVPGCYRSRYACPPQRRQFV